MWIPSNPSGAIQLRLASRASGANSVASGGDAVWVIDRPEDQGIFQPFGRKDSVVVRGDIRDEQFDLDLVFIGNAASRPMPSATNAPPWPGLQKP